MGPPILYLVPGIYRIIHTYVPNIPTGASLYDMYVLSRTSVRTTEARVIKGRIYVCRSQELRLVARDSRRRLDLYTASSSAAVRSCTKVVHSTAVWFGSLRRGLVSCTKGLKLRMICTYIASACVGLTVNGELCRTLPLLLLLKAFYSFHSCSFDRISLSIEV